jgi:hypothetical protein
VYLDKTRAEVRQISLDDAEELIMKYEWLDTFGTKIFMAYGLFYDGEIGGAVAFSRPYTPQSANFIAGKEYGDRVCVLARGVCRPDMPNNSSSYLISNSLNQLWKDTDYRIVLAYADERAGEVGKVYQASNWMYIGATKKHAEFKYDGRVMHGKSARAYCKRNNLPPPSYNGEEFAGFSPPKHRYIQIIGDKREVREIKENLRVKPRPYPSKPDDLPFHIIAEIKSKDND